MKISAIPAIKRQEIRIQDIKRQSTRSQNAVLNSAPKGGLQGALFDTVSFGTRGKIYTKTDPAIKSIETVKERGGIVPERVETLAREYAKDETLSKLTLAEVHKIAYQDLKKCKTLDEAKELYPEFAGVKPAKKVLAKEGSVLYGIQIGEVNIDSCGEDTEDSSLKLLQYIWAELYSAARVSKFVHYTGRYYATHDALSTINKLQIPLLNYEYAQAAKFEKGHNRKG